MENKTDSSYCVSCRQKTNTTNSQVVATKNGRKMMKGNCEICNNKKCKFVKN